MRQAGKAESLQTPLDDHSEKAFILDVLPDRGRKIRDKRESFPNRYHRAQLFAFVVEEALFIGGQPGRGMASNRGPTGIAGNSSPSTTRAGFDGVPLGLRHWRQHLRNAVRTTSLTTLRRSTGNVQNNRRQKQHDGDDQQRSGVSHWPLHTAASAAKIAAVHTHPTALR